MRCFEIFINKEQVGDITITELDEWSSELDIVIFDEYSNKGHGKEAIKEFIDIYRKEVGQSLEVVIRYHNQFKDKVRHMLINNGFEFNGNSSKGDLLFSITF